MLLLIVAIDMTAGHYVTKQPFNFFVSEFLFHVTLCLLITRHFLPMMCVRACVRVMSSCLCFVAHLLSPLSPVPS